MKKLITNGMEKVQGNIGSRQHVRLGVMGIINPQTYRGKERT